MINMRVKRVSMIGSPTHSAIKRLHSHNLNVLVAVIAKEANDTLLVHPKNESYHCVHDFCP